MSEVRRFDGLEQTVAATAQRLDDKASTLANRIASHTHPAPPSPDPLDLSGTQRGMARFSSNAAQSISASTNTVVSFPTTEESSTMVTVSTSGAGHQFTLSESGIWAVATTIRYLAASGSGDRYGEIRSTNYGSDQILVAQGGDASPAAATISLAVTDFFPANSVVYVRTFQSTSAALNLVAGPEWRRIRFVLLRKCT